MVRAHGVEVAPGGLPRRIGDALVEESGVPAVPRDPLPARYPSDGFTYRLGHVREGGHGGMSEVEGERRRRHAEGTSVQVGIVDAGKQRRSPQVDEAGVGSDERRDVVPPADGADDPAGHRQGRGDGELRINRDHPPAEKHQVRIPVHRSSFRNRVHRGHPRTISRELWPRPHLPHIGHPTETRSRSAADRQPASRRKPPKQPGNSPHRARAERAARPGRRCNCPQRGAAPKACGRRRPLPVVVRVRRRALSAFRGKSLAKQRSRLPRIYEAAGINQPPSHRPRAR